MHPGMWLQLTQEAEPRKDPNSGPPCSLQVRLMQESVRRIIEAEESRMGEKAWPFLGQGGRWGSSEEHGAPAVRLARAAQPRPASA